MTSLRIKPWTYCTARTSLPLVDGQGRQEDSHSSSCWRRVSSLGQLPPCWMWWRPAFPSSSLLPVSILQQDGDLDGLVVKASDSSVGDHGFKSQLRRFSDMRIDAVLTTRPGAWRYGVSAWAGFVGLMVHFVRWVACCIAFVLGSNVYNACFHFYICICSAQLSMSYMGKRYRNKIISIIASLRVVLVVNLVWWKLTVSDWWFALSLLPPVWFMTVTKQSFVCVAVDSFSVRPIVCVCGSKLVFCQTTPHVNSTWASLFQDGERNVFYDPQDPLKLSATARHWLAGLLHHAPALTALTCPTVNCYRRLQPGGFAPATIFWDVDNRLSAVRAKTAKSNVFLENRYQALS